MKFIFFREGRKMLTKKKKIFILVGMVVLLAVTGYLNFKLNNAGSKTETANTSNVTASFFVTYRTERTSARESELAILNEIIANTSTTPTERSLAVASKQDLVAKIEKELILEGLVKAKGFEDAVVTIGSSYYNVIVKNANQFTSDEVAQILAVITSETGCLATNVKIIPMD